MSLCSDYHLSDSVVLGHVRRPNVLNLDVIVAAMPLRDVFCLMTYRHMRRPNALNHDIIDPASCRDIGQRCELSLLALT